MSQKKADPAADLAGRMLQVLESQRSFGGDAYPPTLQHLGELCDGAPSHDLIIKAAAKKAFTDRAVVQKVEKKPSLNSPVYFKEDLPKPDQLLARRMVAVLETQRRLGEEAYPPSLRRLAGLCEFKGSENIVRKAAATAPMADRTMVLAKKGKVLILDAPVVFREDVEGDLAAALPGLLRFALSPVASKTKKGIARDGGVHPEGAGQACPSGIDASSGGRGPGGPRPPVIAARGRFDLQGRPAALPAREHQARGSPPGGARRRPRGDGASARGASGTGIRRTHARTGLRAGVPGGIRIARPPQRLDQLREAVRPAGGAVRLQPRGLRRRTEKAPDGGRLLAGQPRGGARLADQR